MILGAPFDGGTSHRSGARFGPQAIRMTDYLAHDGSRPRLALRTDGLQDLRVVDAGDVEMFSGDIEVALPALEAAVEKVARAGAIPVILGGDHTVAWPDVKGVANVLGQGRVSMIHFDAHADTGDIEFGSLLGHGQPMRRLIESGALRGDRFLQIGLRGYWPPPEILQWMAEQGMRSYEMTEIVHRGLETCLTEAFEIATDDCDGVFLSVDIDVCDPGHAPGTGTPEPGGLTARQLLDAVRRICLELPVVGVDVVEVGPPYDHADITAALANRVVLEALSASRGGAGTPRGGTRWDPTGPSWSGAVEAACSLPSKRERRPAARLKSLLDAVPKQLLIDGSRRDATKTFAVEHPRPAEPDPKKRRHGRRQGACLTPPSGAQRGWASMPPRERGEILRAAYLRDHQAGGRVALLITFPRGKPLAESRGEVAYARSSSGGSRGGGRGPLAGGPARTPRRTTGRIRAVGHLAASSASGLPISRVISRANLSARSVIRRVCGTQDSRARGGPSMPSRAVLTAASSAARPRRPWRRPRGSGSGRSRGPRRRGCCCRCRPATSRR